MTFAAADGALLTRERAVALQTQLLASYTKPQFQKALDELKRTHSSHGPGLAEGRRELVRKVQADVLPQYGFQATDEGARQMVVQVERFMTDKEVASLAAKVDEALACDSRGGFSRKVVVAILQELLAAFSSEDFQMKIRSLQSASASSLRDDGFSLEGRAEVALEIQREILPRYGLEGSRHGVHAMLSEASKHMGFPEVSQLMDCVNAKLGMKPTACARFRQRLQAKMTSSAASSTQAPADSGCKDVLAVFDMGAELPAESSKPKITKARAAALFSDLLLEFNSDLFQEKLQALIDRAILRGSQDLMNVPGRKELVHRVQCEVLPHYGFTADAAGLESLVKALQPLMDDPALVAKVEAVERKLRIPKAFFNRRFESWVSDDFLGSSQPAHASQGRLTKVRCIELLRSLLARYTDPGFQRRLRSVRDGQEDGSPRDAFKRMVRSVQVDVLPAFGFKVTDAGVKEMMAAVDSLRDDEEVAKLVAAVEETLYFASSGSTPAYTAVLAAAKKAGAPATSSQGLLPRREAALSKLSRNSLLSLLREQLIEFSTPAFQSKMRELKEASRYDESDDCFYLLGRDELALSEQCRILPSYGLEGSRKGVQTLRTECVQHVSDPEVARLLLEINKKLGMEPSALTRYITQLREEASLLQQGISPDEGTDMFFIRQPSAPSRAVMADAGTEQATELPLRSRARSPIDRRGHADEMTERQTCSGFAKAPASATSTAKPAIVDASHLVSMQNRFYAPARGHAASAAKAAASGDGAVLSLPSQAATASPAPAIASAAIAPAAAAAAAPAAAVVSTATAAAATAAATPAATAAPVPKLSKGRTAALITELELGFKSKGSKMKLQKEQTHDEERRAAEVRKLLLSEVLPQYGFDASDEGLQQVWQAAKPWLGDLGLTARAETLFADLGGKTKEQAVAVIEPEPAPVVEISSEQALSLHNELLEKFSAPSFQKRLGQLYRSHASCSADFGRLFADLLNPVLDPAFKKYGLPAASEDLGGAFIALGQFFAEPEAQAPCAAIEEALFGTERLPPLGGPGLLAVVGALRQQLAGFSTSEIQQKVSKLRASAPASDKASGFFSLAGRAELALGVQEEALPLHGFEGSRRGVHALLTRSAQLAGVPHVAAMLDAINGQLGMDADARRRFKSRMVQMAAAEQMPAAAAGA